MKGEEMSMLTADQARQLLAPVGDVEIEVISTAAITNDVFGVVTDRARGFVLGLRASGQ